MLAIFTVLAFLLLLPHDIELLAGMFAYGALIAFALAHLSVCRAALQGARSAPGVQGAVQRADARGASCRCRPPLGAFLSIAGWIGTFIYHDEARLFGTLWMALGLCLYVVYRSREGLSLTRRVEVPAEQLTYEPEVTYGNILVPVFGEALDDDIMSTAGQLASDKGPEGGAAIEVIYVLVVPMSLPLDAPLPEQQARSEAERRSSGRSGWGRSTRAWRSRRRWCAAAPSARRSSRRRGAARSRRS